MSETKLAKDYEFDPTKQPKIDGEPVPWYVNADPGPMVEAIGPNIPMHILWLPIVIDAPMPSPPEGHPDAEPLAGVSDE